MDDLSLQILFDDLFISKAPKTITSAESFAETLQEMISIVCEDYIKEELNNQ